MTTNSDTSGEGLTHKDYRSFMGTDTKAIAYLIMTTRNSPIIRDFINSMESNNPLSELFRGVYIESTMCRSNEMISIDGLLQRMHVSPLDTEEMKSILTDAWKAAREDYAWAESANQDGSPGLIITERSFYKESASERTCDKCGELICQGDRFYRRTIIYPAVRHVKCNNSIRFASEFSFIDYVVRSTETIQGIFMTQDYSLPHVPEKLVTMLRRQKFEITDNSVTALPGMGEFIMDYISGADDFTIARKYIPYLSYLICFLHMRHISFRRIKMMGPELLMLRNNDEVNRDVKDILFSTGYVDIRCGRYGEIAIEKEVRSMLAEETLSFLFSRNGLSGPRPGTVIVGGEIKNYSCGEGSSDTDIRITIENDGAVLCSDSETCKDFCAYFRLDDPVSANVLRYLALILR